MKVYNESYVSHDDVRIEGEWFKTMSQHPSLDRYVFTIYVRGLPSSNHIELVLSELEAEALAKVLLPGPPSE